MLFVGFSPACSRPSHPPEVEIKVPKGLSIEAVSSVNHLIEPVTRLLLLGLLIVFCIQIVSPFLEFFIWGVILATAVHPVFEKLAVRCYGRQGLAAGLMVVVALSLLIIPVYPLG